MKRTTKYVALDVHQATTASSVRDETGHVIARAIIPTEAESRLAFGRSMRGAVHVAFEEGTQAQWRPGTWFCTAMYHATRSRPPKAAGPSHLRALRPSGRSIPS